jgi:sialidase-1
MGADDTDGGQELPVFSSAASVASAVPRNSTLVVGTAGCLREKAMAHSRTLVLILSFAVNAAIASSDRSAAADDARMLTLDETTHARCLEVLREGLAADDFWPSIHAAEGLTLGGYGEEVIAALTPRLASETDDQRRCGLSRELVRAGQRLRAGVMLEILAGDDPHGHVHAAESLYKVEEVGDGTALRQRFETTDDLRLKLMAAGALGRCGNPEAMTFLRKMLKHEDPELFKVAAWILGRIGDESDIARLKQELPRCREELTRAYFDHSLAALGDTEGVAGLRKNLTSGDPAVRTYAATFVGDARDLASAQTLIGMLEDPHADARYRAAQSLLVLASSPPPDRREDVSRLVYESTDEHPRHTEGSILELADGSLLFAVTQFAGSGSDFATAHIIARVSSDGGRTWGEPRVVQENTGGMNVMSVTLRRLSPQKIALFYLQKNSVSDLDLYVRFSEDESQTFGEPVLVTANDGYHVVNNDRITQLSTGRLLAPAASTPDVRTDNHFVSHCYLSDDGGRTWRDSEGQVDAPRRGAMEPEVIELTDGRVMMLIRTQLGFIGKSYSSDGGETWSEMTSLGVQAPEAPATVRRIPSTGDLLLIWNNTYTPGAGHGGKRTPLTAAISADEGETWNVVGNLEESPDRTYSYTSLTFVRDRAVLSYWEGEGNRLSCRFRSLPVSWIYR